MSRRDRRSADRQPSAPPVPPGSPFSRQSEVDHPTAESDSRSLIADGGRKQETPLADRSREYIDSEIEELEQNPEQYETRDQAVIDRYEGLLKERQRRQRERETSREAGLESRLSRLKNSVLRALGLR